MKKIISLCLSCTILLLACASCSQLGLTLPSAITTPPVSQTSQTNGASLAVTTQITTSAKTTARTTKLTTTAPPTPPDLSKVAKIDFLDFRPEMNKWADRDADGNLIYTIFTDKDLVDENGNLNTGGSYQPFALYLENLSFGANYEFAENGETLKLTSTDANNPCIAFQLSQLNVYPIGAENISRAEYVKIRFKNKSSATKLTFMGTNNSYSNGRLDARVRATIEVEPNSDEWQTIYLSMVIGTQNSGIGSLEGKNTWNSYLKQFAIYPFGYGTDCEATVGAEIEIDYVIIGSRPYIESYQSDLEKAGYKK